VSVHDPRFEPVASTRHTIVLSAILLLVAGVGWLSLHSATNAVPTTGGPSLYVGLAAAELGLLYYVWVGVRGAGKTFRDLLSSRSITVRSLLLDVVVGALLLLLLHFINHLLNGWFGAGDTRLVRPLVAAARSQPLLWIILSLTAAVSEELTFRGYLQRQFLAWSQSPFVAVICQAVMFAVAHGYQGGVSILKIAILGMIFGIVAWLRASRLAGIVAHAGLDIVGGLGAFG
jgi:membrane protease YdiL (CAAX protease family)